MWISDGEFDQRASFGHIEKSIVGKFDATVLGEQYARKGEGSMNDTVLVQVHKSIQNLCSPVPYRRNLLSI